MYLNILVANNQYRYVATIVGSVATCYNKIDSMVISSDGDIIISNDTTIPTTKGGPMANIITLVQDLFHIYITCPFLV